VAAADELPQLLAYLPVVQDAGLQAATGASIVAAAAAANAWMTAQAPTRTAPWVVGVHIGGLFAGEPAAERDERLRYAIAATPPHLLRVITGLIPPVAALRAVAAGVDVIDSSYPLWLTRQGYAANWEAALAGTGTSGAGGAASGPPFLDITSPALAGAMQPLSLTCTCYACGGLAAPGSAAAVVGAGLQPGDRASAPLRCRGHTRGYLHHLWNCGELLHEVLLQAHNAAQFSALMAAARAAVADHGTGGVTALMDRLTAAWGAGDAAWEVANPMAGKAGTVGVVGSGGALSAPAAAPS
jgi:queuine/archaeosine tRNA-ribosyltransferase